MSESSDESIIDLRHVNVVFKRPSGEPLSVLQSINLSLRDGEIVGLLGRSGSGKSTLLRVAGGLIRPTDGMVNYRKMPLTGPAEGIAVVFQTFALFPWLTVLENVEAGLDALALPQHVMRSRALSAIDLIGLGGFETAYPRELSGGMRQRVGFARALVTDPDVLLMDEPFSALDVLTAETLRTDLLDLWIEHQLPTKSMLIVTHNVEEAVLMCNRVVVLAPNPGHVAAEIPIMLPHPRNRTDEEFRCIVDEIYSALAARTIGSIGPHGPAQPLPMASVNRMSGLIGMLAGSPFNGEAELAGLASSLALKVDDLFPVAEALHMLEFAELKANMLKLTAAGRIFADVNPEQRKILFKEHMLRFVPLAAHICRVLTERADHRAPRVRFEIELEDHLSRRDAKNTMRIATSWGRYAEAFRYDDKTGMLSQNASVT